MSEVELRSHGRVAEIRLNRPDKLNAMNMAVFGQIHETAVEIGSSDQYRAVVVTGEGRSFSAGLDLSSLGEINPGSNPALAKTIASVQRTFAVFTHIPQPVIAAVHGHAYGAGLQLALSADIRFASPDSVWSVFEINYGLIPDLGATVRLPRLVGPGVAKHLIWTGEKFSGTKALEYGLVEFCEPDPVAAAMGYAEALAARPPLPVRLTKRLVDESWNRSIDAGIEAEAAAQMQALGSNDLKLAISAAFDGTTPEYTGE